MRTTSPVAAFHSLTVSSSDPLATHRPSGENATEFTQPECPDSVRTTSPVAASHSLTVLSLDPLATHRPSGEKATDFTQYECPDSVRGTRPFCRTTPRDIQVPALLAF